MKINSIKEIAEDLKKGKMVIVMDDEKRENEGDLIMAASKVFTDNVNFMVKYGRGLVCVPMEGKRLEQLGLYSMSSEPQDPYKTAWVISVDARRGITTGISAQDRAYTIRLLANKKTRSSDFAKPGHV
ncbi:MAG: 3,4-dihydroxy-2-butanone-4-phosphate synthase, partial [Candidatus Omnitrophica bacterium]|nr:3,4-dihydroxy-2-butanone-4-phosphate synthase [Candidatus Omnitrophota bacterium]